MKGKAYPVGLICPAQMSFNKSGEVKISSDIQKLEKEFIGKVTSHSSGEEIKNEIKKKLYAQQYKIDSHVTYTKINSK